MRLRQIYNPSREKTCTNQSEARDSRENTLVVTVHVHQGHSLVVS